MHYLRGLNAFGRCVCVYHTTWLDVRAGVTDPVVKACWQPKHQALLNSAPSSSLHPVACTPAGSHGSRNAAALGGRAGAQQTGHCRAAEVRTRGPRGSSFIAASSPLPLCASTTRPKAPAPSVCSTTHSPTVVSSVVQTWPAAAAAAAAAASSGACQSMPFLRSGGRQLNWLVRSTSWLQGGLERSLRVYQSSQDTRPRGPACKAAAGGSQGCGLRPLTSRTCGAHDLRASIVGREGHVKQ